MIDTLWDFNDPAGSETRFRERLGAIENDQSPCDRIELLTQIARAQGLQRRFAEGHATLDAAEAVEGAGEGRAAVRIALERGRLRNSAGSADEAVTHFLTALQLAESSGEDALAVDAAHMLGIASAPDEQLGWNLTALARAESSRDPVARAWLGSLLNNIGWAHHDRGDYAAALDAFERAAAVRRERGQLAETRIAEWSVARAMRSLGRVDDALAIQSRLATELADAGESDPYVREELGECLVALGRHEEAIVHLRAAYDELSRDEWLQTHEPARLARLQRLAEGART